MREMARPVLPHRPQDLPAGARFAPAGGLEVPESSLSGGITLPTVSLMSPPRAAACWRFRDLAALVAAIAIAEASSAAVASTGAIAAVATRASAPAPTHPARPLDRAAEHDSLALIAFSAGGDSGWTVAHAQFERSLEIKQRVLGMNDPDVARTLMGLATLDDYRGRWDEASRHAEEALRIRKQRLAPTDPATANSLRQLGMLRFQLGQVAAAETLVAGALSIYAAAGPEAVADAAQACNDLGEIHRVLDRGTESERDFVRGLELARTHRAVEDPLRAALLNNLAGLYRDRARYADAEPLLEESLRLRESPPGAGPVAIATARLNLAEIYRLQGRNDDAAPLYAKALELARPALGAGHPSLAAFVNQAAVSFEEDGRLDEAEPLFREALAGAEQALGPRHPLVAQTLDDLGRLLERRGAWAAAESTYRRALEIREAALGPEHPDAASVRVDLARCLWHGPHHEAAAAGALLASAVAVLDSARENPEARLEAHALASELDERAGEHERAATDLSAALDLLDTLRAERGGGDATRAQFVEEHLGLPHRMVALQLARGDPDAALAAHERGRARVLRDQIAGSGVDLRAGIPPADRRALERAEDRARDTLSHAQRLLEQTRASTRLSPGARLAQVAALETARDCAAHALQRASESIKDRSPVWRALLEHGARTTSREDIQRALQPHECLLEYHLGDDGAWAFVVSGRGGPARAFPLRVGSQEASELGLAPGAFTAAAAERAMLGDTTRTARRRAGLAALLAGTGDAGSVAQLPADREVTLVRKLAALGRVLLPQALWNAVRGASEVVLVPDGALHLVPFEALVVGPAHPDGRERDWLDQGPAVRYASSAGSWLALEARRAGREAPTDRKSALSVSDVRLAGAEASRWAPLPATRQETDALVRAFGRSRVDILQGDAATEPVVRAALPGHAILHLATHGYVTAKHSDVLAGLVLRGVPDSTSGMNADGVLQLFEIYGLRLDADLAVLSACETASGSRVAGEGVFALSRGFLAAGAARVVASLWAVQDASTADLMTALFGRSPNTAHGERDWSLALRDAKRAVRARPEWASPTHWAAFVLTGVR